MIFTASILRVGSTMADINLSWLRKSKEYYALHGGCTLEVCDRKASGMAQHCQESAGSRLVSSTSLVCKEQRARRLCHIKP